MIYVWIAAFLLLAGVAAAEDLAKLSSYAVVFGVSASPSTNLSKINAYAVVTGGSAPVTPGLGGGAFGSLSLGIN